MPHAQSAVRLTHKYGIRDFSNYILFNYTDYPIDLWERLKINIELCAELNVDIFSFLMRYAPINEINRHHVGKHWKKKYLSPISAKLPVTKGIVARGGEFFYRAFGSNPDEYFEILSMPRDFIIYRNYFEKSGLTSEWRKEFQNFSVDEKDLLIDSIDKYPTYLDLYSNISVKMQSIVYYYFISYKQLTGRTKSL